uniref:uncharacterized protein LOC120344125 isoform X1 n=1 Tax=Styela clava TaxID=7725 RepID=UPI00193A9D7A|nr:uncharacterized protein LOC120344125 isoform X1 [Styela clava]
MSKVINKLYDFSRRGIRRQIQLHERTTVDDPQTPSTNSVIDNSLPVEVDSESHCFASRERNASDAGDAMTSLSLQYLNIRDSDSASIQRNSILGDVGPLRTTMEGENQSENESLAWCRLLYNRSYSSSTNTSSSPGSYVTRKSSRISKRLARKSIASKRLQRLKIEDDDVFSDSPSSTENHIYTSIHPSPPSRVTQQIDSGHCSNSPTDSCRSEGTFSKRGQLKLVICGSERRLTVTVLELKGLEPISNRQGRSVYIRLSLSPDAYENERYKTTVNEITGHTVNFHETFTFQLPNETTSRRLLISAWQRFEHRENSEFIGCMSFSVRKLKFQQKVIHGWYQLLGEILGRRKHLAARTMPENNTNQGIRKAHKRDLKHRHGVNMTRSKSTLCSKLRPLAEHQLNARANDNAIDAYYKNLFNFDGSPKETKRPLRRVTGQENENVRSQQRDVNVVRRKKEIRTRNSPALRRYLSETGRNERNRKRENSIAPVSRPSHQSRTPKRRGARDLSNSPNFVMGPAFVRSHRTKSARIISKRQSELKLKPRDQQAESNNSTFRILYSDELECQSSSSNFRPISISSQDDVSSTSTQDLKTLKTVTQLEPVNCKTEKIIGNVSGYLSIPRKEESSQSDNMPAIQSDMMYVDPATLEFDSAMLEHGLTLSRTGRVRAKKQHLRMAAYLESQKAANATDDEREYLNLSNTDLETENNNNIETRRWKRISTKVDEDRGYCSEPEFDEDEVVELFKVQKNSNEMAPVFSPPPTILHSTHTMLEKFDHLDNLDTLKTQVELLTLNDVSRAPHGDDTMPKKRRRPSFLIALLQPFRGNAEKSFMDATFSNKIKSTSFDDIAADLIPLLEKSSPCCQKIPFITPQDTANFFSKSQPIFGSSQSLCSERSYRIRREKSAMERFRKMRKNKFFKTKISSSSDEDSKNLITEIAIEIESPRKQRSNSANEESTRMHMEAANVSPTSMTLNRLPRSRKLGDEAGSYVHITRRNMECKSADIYSLRDNSSKNHTNDDSEEVNRKSNALGTLMTWFQRKSPESRDSSPFGHRSASISGRPSSTLSRRSRSFSRNDTLSVNREKRADSDETGDVVLRRNSFTSGRRSMSKRSFRQSKRSIMDENAKPADMTLEEMMKNKVAMQAFRDYLKSEYSEENLDFWLDCEAYKTMKSSKQMKMAFKIFSQYLARSAPREINIDFETRARTEERLKNPDKETFVEPQNCIYSLMKCDSFRRFLASEKFSKLQPLISSDKNGFENRMNTLKIGL